MSYILDLEKLRVGDVVLSSGDGKAAEVIKRTTGSHVLRCGWKERALVERWSGCLIGQGSGLTRFMFGASGGPVSFGV